jgi:hypothetical protein
LIPYRHGFPYDMKSLAAGAYRSLRLLHRAKTQETGRLNHIG